jgi:polysaccharide export outer membrane protein
MIPVAALLLVPAAAQPPRQPATPELGANLPVQRIGANDLVAVSVFDAPEFTRTLRVDADGFIRLPMLQQQIKAAGLFPAGLERSIAKALRDEKFLVDPFVTVTIAEYHSRPISVSGAVRLPLVFQAEGPTTLLEAVARAQGLREDAGREILISSSQPGDDGKPLVLTRRVSVRSLFDATDPSLNLILTGGEEIRVPEVGRVYVVGNVRKPGAFPVQDGADTTVLQMVALSEGLTQFASKQAYIYRREAGGVRNEIAVPLDMIMSRKAPDVPLEGDDIFYVPDNKGRRMTIGTLEKILAFGSAAGAAAIYSTVH